VKAAGSAALIAVLFASGCLTLRKPTIVFQGVSIGDVNRDGAALDVELGVTNENSYRLGVRQLTYQLSVGGTPAGEGAIEAAVSIAPHETTTVRLPLTLAFAPFKGRALEMALSGGIDYTIEGEVVFTTPMGPVRRPYRHSDRLSLFR
jgi:LEA14-like dessication related protein